MTFTIICNKCGFKRDFVTGDNPITDDIEISVTETCGFQGCVVDTIDLYCSNCYNEVNL